MHVIRLPNGRIFPMITTSSNEGAFNPRRLGLQSIVLWVICVWVWTGRILPWRPKLLRTSIHGLHMICSNKINYQNRFCREGFTQEKKLANTLHIRSYCETLPVV